LGIQDALKSFGKEKTGTIIVLSDGSDDKTLIEQDIKKLLQEQFIDLIVI